MNLTARQELITIQKQLVEELKESLYDTVGRRDESLDRYYRHYQREFKQGYDRLSSRDEIIQRLMRANIAYFGDYHTLRSAQTAVLDLLQGAAERGRKVVLALEMLHAADKHHAQDYLDGEIDDEAFRWRVKWDRTWGFPWASYKRLFGFSKRYDAQLFGVNINADDRDGDLHYRDEYAGDLISALTHLYPERLVAVLYGDLHLAHNHLPRVVDHRLAKYGTRRRSVTVYQNSETLYWKLVEQRLEHVVDYIKLRRDVYVVMNATPLVKFQSFANWQHRRQEIVWEGGDDLDLQTETVLLDQVHQYVRTIIAYLGIELEETANFEVYSSADLDFLSDLVLRGVYTADEMEALKDYLGMAESAFFERARVLYVANFTVANAGEGAARYVLSELRPESGGAVDARDEFYARCMVEAMAFFCSKIIDPRRHARRADEWQAILKKYGRRRKLGRIQRLDVQCARGFLRHKQYEARALETGSMSGAPRNLFGLPTDQHVMLTRALGRELGDRLYDGIGAGDVTKQQVREVMQDDIRRADVARERYFEMLRMAPVSGPAVSRDSSLPRSFMDDE
ncbi:MAG: ChaN family lipoprotein [Planctomycetes bacterium]|nr:ChaN family lipoprotein [Planctomycetota bacterium]